MAWITGYSDGTFKPEQNITRSEVAVIVNRMLARNADHDFIDVYPHQLERFADVDILQLGLTMILWRQAIPMIIKKIQKEKFGWR